MSSSAVAGPLPPATPTKAQQLLLNRQSYLQAAHQHQSTIRQQQSAFQQRLAIFSRDVQGARIQKPTFSKAPTFALPTPTASLLKSGAASHPASPSRRTESPLRTLKTSLYPAAAASSVLSSGKTSSLPTHHAASSLAQLARLVNPQIVLQKSAQRRLLQIADVFTEQLVKQAAELALHRAHPLGVEDVQLALDLTCNYQPAGQGSIENCRPPKKPQIASFTAATENASSSTTGSLAHHHRVAVIKKHATLYNSHQGRINED
jgi:histone H3/H4